jgi:hypothetical protein
MRQISVDHRPDLRIVINDEDMRRHLSRLENCGSTGLPTRRGCAPTALLQTVTNGFHLSPFSGFRDIVAFQAPGMITLEPAFRRNHRG